MTTITEPNFTQLALHTLATARLTRLGTRDTYPPATAARTWWTNHTPPPWHKLATCPWCQAPYWAALITIANHHAPRTTRTITTTLAIAYLAAHIETRPPR